MKKAKILLILILIFLFLSYCSKKILKEDVQLKCIVTFIEGKVFLINEDNSIINKLSVGKNLNENNIIRTEKNSTIELQFRDNSIVRVKENSILKILKLFQEDESKSTNLFLNVGKILANPEQQTEGSSFEVETKSVTVGVRGTEFTVISDQKGSKIAVNTGKVRVKNKIKVDAIEDIKDIDPEIAEKIDSTINPEITLSAEEKIEVNDEELKKVESDISVKINEIAENLEKIKESKEEIEIIIETIEEVKIKEISKDINKVIKKETATQEELVNKFNTNEFENIKKRKEILKNKIKKESKKEKENEKVWKEYESLFKKPDKLIREGKKDAALKMAKKTLVKAKKELGDEARITAHAMLHLSVLYIWETNQLNEAENLIKQAIKIYEKVNDNNDSTLCHLYKHYGELFLKKKEYNNAKNYFNKSINMSEKRLKAGVEKEIHFISAKTGSLTGLANLYSEQKDFIKAEELYKETIQIIEKNAGKYSTELKHVLENYKQSLIKQNKKDEVSKIDKRILLIMENNPEFKNELEERKKHNKIENVRKKYEKLFEETHKLNREGKKDDAAKLAKETLANAKKETGDNSRITAHAMQNLGIIYTWETDQLNEAEKLLKGAIDIYENIDDKNDPTLCHLYHQYASVFYKEKEYDKAKTFFNKSIKLSEKGINEGVKEKTHLYRAKATALNGLANLYSDQNDFNNAEKLFKEAISITEKNEGKYNSQLIHILDSYRNSLKNQNKKIEVENIDKKILLIMENNPEFKDELKRRKKEKKLKDTWEEYESLFQQVHKLNKEGKKDAALKLAKETLEKAKTEVGDNSRITAHAMQNLGIIYTWETDQLNEAEKLLKGAIDIYENIDDKNDPTLCHLYHQYASVFYKEKEYDKAKTFFNKAINLTENRITAGVESEFNFYRAKATALNGLANLYSEQKNYIKAEEMFNEAIIIIEKSEGKKASELKHILEDYKRFFEMQNKKTEAEKIEKRIRLLENKSSN